MICLCGGLINNSPTHVGLETLQIEYYCPRADCDHISLWYAAPLCGHWVLTLTILTNEPFPRECHHYSYLCSNNRHIKYNRNLSDDSLMMWIHNMTYLWLIYQCLPNSDTGCRNIGTDYSARFILITPASAVSATGYLASFIWSVFSFFVPPLSLRVWVMYDQSRPGPLGQSQGWGFFLLPPEANIDSLAWPHVSSCFTCP